MNIFVDMDGVLAEYYPDTVEHMYDKGFFLNRPPMTVMIETVKMLIDNPNYEVYILSSVIDSPYVIKEKEEWLDQHLPELGKENRLFVPYGEVKAKFVRDNLAIEGDINVLLDDHTDNLINWNFDNGIAIKVINLLNGVKGRWSYNDGLEIQGYGNAKANYKFIVNEINDKYAKIA